MSAISRASGLPYSTLRRYLALLETTFLVQLIPAWSSSRTKRFVKSPKLALCDTALGAHLLGIDADRLEADATLFGALLETSVAMEVRKQATWTDVEPQLFHFRTHAGREVDLVLEDSSGQLVGIEVKARSTALTRDFAGLRALAEIAGDRFHRGVVLYTGEETVGFGERLHAIPVGALWAAPPGKRPPRPARASQAGITIG